jgi:protein O-mannosyl-transferase
VTPQTDGATCARGATAWAIAGLVLAVVLAYLPVWRAEFIWDDDLHVTANPVIVGPLGLKEIWTSPAANYFPLTMTSFWLLHAIWGLDPLPYHLVNVAMHAGCGVLLWLVLRKLQIRGAWLGAALWTLHPVQVESVAWISELKNTQSGVFFLLAVWCFLRWTEDRRAAELHANEARSSAGGPTTANAFTPERYYVLALLCAVFAIFSKSSTVMLPVVFVVCWWWLGVRWTLERLLRLAPFFLISAVAAGWTIWEQKFSSGAQGAEWSHGLIERVAIAGRVPWFYLGKLLWPEPLIFIYPRWQIDASHLAAFLPGLALAAVLTLLFVWRRRGSRVRATLFASGYFLVSLFPVLGFFDVYFFRYSFVGDHFQYLASMGPLALVAAGISVGCGRIGVGWVRLRQIAGASLIVVFCALSARHARLFASDRVLWLDTATRNPSAWIAQNNIAKILIDEGTYADAIRHLGTALRLKPDHQEAHYNLGNALRLTGDVAGAIEHYEVAVRLNPNDTNARNNLAGLLLQTGRGGDARTHYEHVLRLRPDSAEVHYNFAALLVRLGHREEARAAYENALRLRPDYAAAHSDLANLLMGARRTTDAIAHYEAALRAEPNHAAAHFNLAGALLRLERIDEAVQHYESALRANPDFVEAHYSLGVVHLATGKTADAVAHFEAALRVRPDFEPAQKQLAQIRAGGR